MTEPNLAFVLTDPVARRQIVALLPVLLTSAGNTAQEDRSGNPT
ncbi:hypothetical protein [Blastochloris tepida]|nr:hypothetical protein [Blastochloris tepida]